jgi:TorA maturation chaperone TorD
MHGKALAEVRNELALLGIARRAGATMAEDHLAALCETMRLLAAGREAFTPVAPILQREFLERHLAPWVFDCCDAIGRNEAAHYYASVAGFTREFIALERESLAME